MTILLVKTNDNNVPASPGQWLAGEIVAAVDDGQTFGAQEVPAAGNFAHLTITDRTTAQVQAYLAAWGHEPTTNIDSNVNGDYTITITSANVSSSGKNAVTKAQMDAFVTQWNGVYVSHTNSTYTFDVSAFAAATSEGLFGDQVGSVVFVDEGFAGGVQTVGVTDFGPFTPAQVAGAIGRAGGVVIDADSFTIPAATLYTEFKDDIENAWRNISFKRRIWTINPAGMALMAGAGNAMSVTAAQALPYLDDGLLS